MLISPNSLTITASFLPCCSLRMRLISVVLPEPRKPVTTVAGILSALARGVWPMVIDQRAFLDAERADAFGRGEPGAGPPQRFRGRQDRARPASVACRRALLGPRRDLPAGPRSATRSLATRGGNHGLRHGRDPRFHDDLAVRRRQLRRRATGRKEPRPSRRNPRCTRPPCLRSGLPARTASARCRRARHARSAYPPRTACRRLSGCSRKRSRSVLATPGRMTLA